MAQKHIMRSIIVPAYSEAECIRRSLASLKEYLQSQGWLNDTEVIVVTADAEDGTPAIVREEIKQFPVGVHLEPGPRVGKGRDVKLGMKAACGEYIIFTDADLATPLHHMAEAFRLLGEKGGMVIGVRQLSHIHNSLKRRMSSVLANTSVRLVIGWDIHDSQCGFKGFTRATADCILSRSDPAISNWGFDFEFIKIAKINAVPIGFLPIPDWSDPKDASANLTGDSQWSAMKRTLFELYRVWNNTRKGKYEPSDK